MFCSCLERFTAPCRYSSRRVHHAGQAIFPPIKRDPSLSRITSTARHIWTILRQRSARSLVDSILLILAGLAPLSNLETGMSGSGSSANNFISRSFLQQRCFNNTTSLCEISMHKLIVVLALSFRRENMSLKQSGTKAISGSSQCSI